MKKRVKRELLDVLEMFPQLEITPESIPLIREGNVQAEQALEVDESIAITDEYIDGPDENQLLVRVYRPKASTDELPAVLWIHGGGYVIGSVNDNDALCMQFVKEIDCVVASVDYRLAPEYPYPVPLEDCYTALKWLADNASALNIDKGRIAVAGASAGGGLTAAVSLLARDRQYPSLCFQMPLYPMINDENNTPSANEITEGMIWNQKSNEAGWKMYLGELYGTEDISPYAAPARAQDFSDLPPTYTCVGQLDPFRSETITYVEKLAEAGVDVEFHLYPGAYHGFDLLNPQSELAKNAVSEYIQALKRGLTLVVSVNS